MTTFKLSDPDSTLVQTELEMLRQFLVPPAIRRPLQDVLEIGCGTGDMTRQIAAEWPAAKIQALEVDMVQLERNRAGNHHANIHYSAGPAEDIPFPDGSFDVVMMFKSLHHVPAGSLDKALAEIRRVLRPGGAAWLAEPVFAGELNDIIRLFHDEEIVRRAAFDAVVRASETGQWASAREVHYRVPVEFADFADFERKVMRVTHSDFRLNDEIIGKVRASFEPHVGSNGARFIRPMRVNILGKEG